MAAGNDYPAEIVDANGHVTEGVIIRFTDSTNQPVAPGAGKIALTQLDATGITNGFLVTADTEVATWEAPA